MITIFVARHCEPCQIIKDLVVEGRVDAAGSEVELVDIETDEGFKRFSDRVLSRGEASVPSAYSGNNICEMLYDDDRDKIIINCPPARSQPSASS